MFLKHSLFLGISSLLSASSLASTVTVYNNLLSNKICTGGVADGNSVTLFIGSANVLTPMSGTIKPPKGIQYIIVPKDSTKFADSTKYAIPEGTFKVFKIGDTFYAVSKGSLKISGTNLETFPGLGIQINNWYWTQNKHPVQGGVPQNPDNSGGQFKITATCSSQDWHSTPWYGDGIGTWLIADVILTKDGNQCALNINKNNYTDTVTPGKCCSPPNVGTNNCKDPPYPWGTLDNTYQTWPPNGK